MFNLARRQACSFLSFSSLNMRSVCVLQFLCLKTKDNVWHSIKLWYIKVNSEQTDWILLKRFSRVISSIVCKYKNEEEIFCAKNRKSFLTRKNKQRSQTGIGRFCIFFILLHQVMRNEKWVSNGLSTSNALKFERRRSANEKLRVLVSHEAVDTLVKRECNNIKRQSLHILCCTFVAWLKVWQ